MAAFARRYLRPLFARSLERARAPLDLPPWLDVARLDIPAAEVVVSCVLFKTPLDECRRIIDLVLKSNVSIHLILVDNSPEPICTDIVRDSRVTIIAAPGNLGYGRAHNVAISLGRGKSPFHLIANTDLIFDAEVLSALADFMRKNPGAGLAMPQIRYFDGRHQPTCRLLPSPWDIVAKRLPAFGAWAARRRRAYLLEDWQRDHVANLPFLTGCFMFFRRQVLEDLGGFDPRFFVYGEDVDLSRRAHEKYATFFVPHVEVLHKFRGEVEPSLKGLLLLVHGYIRYFNKWGWFRDAGRDAINRQALNDLSVMPKSEV